MQDKWVLVCGLANERSIAAAIAQQLDASGARLVLSYQDQRFLPRVEAVAAQLQQEPVLLPCDVSRRALITDAFQDLQRQNIVLDGLVHAIAYGRLFDADKQAIPVHAQSTEAFSEALQISAHSLAQLVHAALPLLRQQASVVALTYAGATQVKDGYNLMGVAKAALEAEVRYLAHECGPQLRVNAISAGPIRTLAASGVPGFKQRLAEHAERAFIRRNVTAEEVAQTALFLLSSASSGISGETIFVDGGAHLRA